MARSVLGGVVNKLVLTYLHPGIQDFEIINIFVCIGFELHVCCLNLSEFMRS